MEQIIKFFDNIGSIFKKNVYQGPIYIHKVKDLRKKLFERKFADNSLNEISADKVYDFLDIIPLHSNFKVSFSLIGLIEFKGKIDKVCDEWSENDRKLKDILEFDNLNDYCKIVLTQEQEYALINIFK